jgi:hypothetical protein
MLAQVGLLLFNIWFSLKDLLLLLQIECIFDLLLIKNYRISFYDLNQTNYNVPVSRIENLVGIPLCLEYYQWPKNKENKIETLLVGDDLGICHMYNITSTEWHYCEYKLGSKDPNKCHQHEIVEKFNKKIEKTYDETTDKKSKNKSLVRGVKD